MGGRHQKNSTAETYTPPPSLSLHTCVMVQCKSTHSESAQPVITSNLTQGPGRSAKQPGRVKTDGLRANKKVGEGGSSVVVVINQANILFFTTTRVEEARSDVTEVRGKQWYTLYSSLAASKAPTKAFTSPVFVAFASLTAAAAAVHLASNSVSDIF